MAGFKDLETQYGSRSYGIDSFGGSRGSEEISTPRSAELIQDVQGQKDTSLQPLQPERELELSISEKVLSAQKQEKLRNDMAETLYDLEDESTFAGIAAGWKSGRYNSILDEAIMDAAEIGDNESIVAINKWKNEFNQTKAMFTEAGDPNAIQSALYQAAESAPYMLKIGLAMGASKMAAQATGHLIAKTALTEATKRTMATHALNAALGGEARRGAMKMFAPALSKAAVRLAASDALLTPAQAAMTGSTGPIGLVTSLAGEVLQWGVIGAMLIWDAVQITRSLTKDEESGMIEAKRIPFLLSPKGRGAVSAAKQMAGAHYSAQIDAGIDPEFISKDAANMVGFLQGAIESIINPFQIVGPSTYIANKTFGKLFTAGIAQQGSRTLKALNVSAKIGAVTAARTLGEMEEEGAQGVVGQYYLSKTARLYIQQHPEIATSSAIYANLASIADMDARDALDTFVEQARAAGPVSLVFAAMGLPAYGINIINNQNDAIAQRQIESEAEAIVRDLNVQELYDLMNKTRAKYSTMKDWSYEDIAVVRASAAKLEIDADEAGNQDAVDRAKAMIKMLDQAEAQGDTLTFLKNNFGDDKLQSLMMPNTATEKQARWLHKEVNAYRAESERRALDWDEFKEFIYNNLDFKTEESAVAPKEVINAVAGLKKALQSGDLNAERKFRVVLSEAYGKTLGFRSGITSEEMLNAIESYESINAQREEAQAQAQSDIIEQERKARVEENVKKQLDGLNLTKEEREGIEFESFKDLYWNNKNVDLKIVKKNLTIEEAYAALTGKSVEEIGSQGEQSMEEKVNAMREMGITPRAVTKDNLAIIAQAFPEAGINPRIHNVKQVKKKLADAGVFEKRANIASAAEAKLDVETPINEEQQAEIDSIMAELRTEAVSQNKKQAKEANKLLDKIEEENLAPDKIKEAFDQYRKVNKKEESQQPEPQAEEAVAEQQQTSSKRWAVLGNQKMGYRLVEIDLLGAKRVDRVIRGEKVSGYLIKEGESSQFYSDADLMADKDAAIAEQKLKQAKYELKEAKAGEDNEANRATAERLQKEIDKLEEAKATPKPKPKPKKGGMSVSQQIVERLSRSETVEDENGMPEKSGLEQALTHINIGSSLKASQRAQDLRETRAKWNGKQADLPRNTGSLIIGASGGKKVEALVDITEEGMAVVEIPVEFFDENGNLKPSVRVRRVVVTDEKRVYPNRRFEPSGYKKTTALQALQVYDTSTERAYNFAVFTVDGMGYPAVFDAQGSKYISSSTALGVAKKESYEPLNVNALNRKLTDLTDKAGLLTEPSAQRKATTSGNLNSRMKKAVAEGESILTKINALERQLQEELKAQEKADTPAKVGAHTKKINKIREKMGKLNAEYRKVVSAARAKDNFGMLDLDDEDIQTWAIERKPKSLVRETDKKAQKKVEAFWGKSKETDEVGIRDMAFRIWYGSRTKGLRYAYEKAFGEDLRTEGRGRDANAESLLMQVIRDHLYRRYTEQNFKSTILDALEGKTISDPQTLFKEVALGIRQFAKISLGEMKGEKAVRSSLRALQDMELTSRREVANKITALLDEQNLFSRDGRLANSEERQALNTLLETMLTQYGMLSTEWEEFSKSLNENGEFDINVRKNTAIYKALVGTQDVYGIVNILSSELDGTAQSLLDDVFSAKTVQTGEAKPLDKFRELTKAFQKYERSGDIRPIKVDGTVGDSKLFQLIASGFKKSDKNKVKSAAAIVANEQLIERSQAELNKLAVSLDELSESDQNGKKGDAIRKKAIGISKTIAEANERISVFEQRTTDEITGRVRLEISRMKEIGIIYSAQRRLTVSVLNMVTAKDSPFRSPDDQSFTVIKEDVMSANRRQYMPWETTLEDDVRSAASLLQKVARTEANARQIAEATKALESISLELKRPIPDATTKKPTSTRSRLRAQAIKEQLQQISDEARSAIATQETKLFDDIRKGNNASSEQEANNMTAEARRIHAHAVSQSDGEARAAVAKLNDRFDNASIERVVKELNEKVDEIYGRTSGKKGAETRRKNVVLTEADKKREATKAKYEKIASEQRAKLNDEYITRATAIQKKRDSAIKAAETRFEKNKNEANRDKSIANARQRYTDEIVVLKNQQAQAISKIRIRLSSELAKIESAKNSQLSNARYKNELDPVRAEEVRSLRHQIAFLQRISNKYKTEQRADSGTWYVGHNDKYQEINSGSFLTQSEYESAVRAEAIRFDLDITDTQEGMILSSRKSGKTLFIRYQREVFAKPESREDPKAGITHDDIITIAGVGANVGTVKHELVEWAFDALLNDSERAVIIKAYKSSHGWATAMENYKPLPTENGRRVNVIVNEIKNFFKRILGQEVTRVDEFAYFNDIANLISEEYNSGVLWNRPSTETDTTKLSRMKTAEDLSKMSRSDLQSAFRIHAAFMKKAGIELKVTENDETSRLIYHLTRPDHYFTYALNGMTKTSAGRQAIKILTNPIASSQLSPAARLEIIATFDPTRTADYKGVIQEAVDNIKIAQAEKVAPIRDRLESYMRGMLTAQELRKHYSVSIGGSNVTIDGHTALSILVAASNPTLREQMLKNKLSFKRVGKIWDAKKATTANPITEQELSDLAKNFKSIDQVIEQWGYMTDDISRHAGPLVNKLVARNAKTGKNKIRNVYRLTEKWKPEKNWYPTIWTGDLTWSGTVGEAISAKESWMSAKRADNVGNTLVIADINEVLAQHTNSAAQFIGLGNEISNLGDVIFGPSTGGNFISKEGMKGWEGQDAERMAKNLHEAFEQIILPAREAKAWTKSKTFRYIKQGQDLYRLASPAAMLRMASSSHLIRPLLTDPKNLDRAYATPKFSPTVSKWFKLNSYQYSRGEQNIAPDVGDTHSRTRGRTILEGAGGPKSAMRNIPSQADRVAMKNIFLASAYDVLTDMKIEPSMSELNARANDLSFWRQVSRKANSFTMETQPTFESFMRSDLLNRGDFISIILTRYGTQRNRMLNMLVTSYAKMKTIDSEATRRDFEKKAMAILGTNAVLMASIAAADTAFKDFVRNSIRGEDDDDMLFAFEKSKDKYGRATDNALKRQIMRSVGTSLAGTSIGLVEGGDDAWRLIQGGYGAVTGKKYLSQRALQGQFLASELTAIYGALESAGTMGRQKVKMREATSISEYMTAKRSYAYSAGKLYQSLSQVVGVGLHLPTRMLDYGVNPKERIRKAVFE